MTWNASEILDMLRRAKELGALSPGSLLGEIQHMEPDTGTGPADGPIHEPHPDPGLEV
jgi:hypothetical protein